MLEKIKIKWVYAACAIYIVLNSIFIINEFYWFSLFPLLFLVVLLLFFKLDKLLLAIVFLTPLSVYLRETDLNIGVYLPTEPLLFAVTIMFLFNVLFQGNFNMDVFRHPVTKIIYVYLGWILITAFTSSMPVVSIKFLVSKLWFILPFYFFGTELFRNYRNIRRFIWLYLIGFCIVIFYTIYRHSVYGFDEQSSHWVMSPFYNDHTSYGALLAMFIPFAFAFIFDKEFKKSIRVASFAVLALMILAVILSYSRAAWVSLAASLLVFLILKFRIDYRIVITVVVLVAGYYIVNRMEIFMRLEQNRQDSSKNYMEHIQSISNISSDASNLERINRWQCALRMFKERPIFGWGPGTYQFKYAPFQHSKEKTTISTNAGDMGNAHSEYIGPLAEQGLPGALMMLVLVSVVSYTAVKLYKRALNQDVKFLTLTILVSLVTYFIHGTLNNFLDTDKASVPFWGMIAMLVAMDLYYKEEKKETGQPSKISLQGHSDGP